MLLFLFCLCLHLRKFLQPSATKTFFLVLFRIVGAAFHDLIIGDL